MYCHSFRQNRIETEIPLTHGICDYLRKEKYLFSVETKLVECQNTEVIYHN